MTPEQAFLAALDLAKTQAALAAIVGKRQPAISKRIAGSCRAEPDEVLAIEQALGVPRELLRPDLYPPSDAVHAAPVAGVGPGSRKVAFDPTTIPNGEAA